MNQVILGLHPNSEVTARLKESKNAIGRLETVMEGSETGHASSEGAVMVSELLGGIPKPFDIDEVEEAISERLGGFGLALNVFLLGELERFNAVVEKVALHLSHAELALKGEMIMSAELESIVSSIEKLHVPSAFSSGVPFPATSIGKWTEHVTLVHKQFFELAFGRKAAYCLDPRPI